jgi:DNA polymerase-3 subunit epsilon
MSWLVQLFRPRADLAPSVNAAVDAWRALPAIADDAPLAHARFVVLDVETGGLNPRRDALLSIGAVVVEGRRVAPRYTFSAVLHNPNPSARENILVHGLTPTMQAQGEPPEQALSEYLSFIGNSPCVAFHADFDRTALERALRARLGVRAGNPWIDLARLAPALVPQAHLARASLDEWLAYFRLQAHVRHNAVHDAQVAAELLLILLARAQARGIATLGGLRALAEQPNRFTTRGDITGV